MSSIIIPQAQRLIFCERYLPDPIAHEVGLHGLIHRVRSSSFPTAIVPFTVYAVLQNGLGEGEMRVTVYECVEEALCSLCWRRQWFHFLTEPNMREFAMPLLRLRFRVPGMHVVVLTFDGVVVAKRFLPVEAVR